MAGRNQLGGRIIEIERQDLFAHFDSFCRALAKQSAPATPWLLDLVSVRRLRRAVDNEARDPRLNFLGGLLREDRAGIADEIVLRAVLARVDAGVDRAGKRLSQLARLSYLWIAVRELAKAPANVRNNELGGKMEKTLRLWNLTAAWYGLHGAHPMGCLAALNDLAFVTGVRRSGPAPHGARASAYYSIAGRMRSREKSFSIEANSMAFAMEKLKRGQVPTAEEQAALLSGYALVMDGITGKTALVVPCPTMGVCTMLLEEFLKNVKDKKDFILAALANPSAWDFTKSEFTAIKAQFRMLLLCAATEPDVYNKFITENREMASKFLAYYGVKEKLLDDLKNKDDARLIFQAAFGASTYVLTDIGLKVNGAIYTAKVLNDFRNALLSDDPAVRAAAEKQRDSILEGLGAAAAYCNLHATECAQTLGAEVAASIKEKWQRIKNGDTAAIVGGVT